MDFLELTTRPTITLADTSIFGAQDADGLTWKQTNLLAIKSNISSFILGANNLFTGSNTFSTALTVGTGTLGNHAANLAQLALKNDKFTGSTSSTIFINVSGEAEITSAFKITDDGIEADGSTSKSGFILKDGFLNLVQKFKPTGSGDITGLNRDFTFDDDYIYIKTEAGWKRAAITTW